jgi:hypothetical protein
MTCAIIGDSIAIGLAALMPQCVVDAKVGIPSAAVIYRMHSADIVVVSAGSNDPRNPRLVDNLKLIRATALGKVIWIAPIDRAAAKAVASVAAIHSDPVIHFEPGHDNVHPRSDVTLAAAVKGEM